MCCLNRVILGLLFKFCFIYDLITFCFCHQPATAFKGAYEGLGLDASSGKSVNMQKMWHLIQVYFLRCFLCLCYIVRLVLSGRF